MLLSVDLTSIGFDKNANIFLTQNLLDCNNKFYFTTESSEEKG